MDTGNTKYAELFYSTVNNDIDTLEKNVKDFPASSIARFLLLYHYKKNRHPRFDELVQQTGIYINNPYWVQYQLSQAEPLNKKETNKEEEKDISVVTDPNEENRATRETEEETISTVTNQPIIADTVENDAADTKENDYETLTKAKEEEEITSTLTNQPITTDTVESDDADTKENDGEILVEEKEEEEEEKTSTVTNQSITTNIVEIDEADTKENDGEILTEAKEEENISTVTNQPITTDTVEIDDTNKKENDGEILIKAKEEEETTSIVTNQPVTTDAVESDDVDEELIAFEPLHTVDYFASQGIKITTEELEKDHFGKQVKSFTAWLKSMKKLHPAQVPEQNEVIEKIIQTSSEVSNQDANVLTEAMAEVLVKQDKKAKAIEMYQKLSLINPSKSAYFAAKIESLNH